MFLLVALKKFKSLVVHMTVILRQKDYSLVLAGLCLKKHTNKNPKKIYKEHTHCLIFLQFYNTIKPP